MTILRAGEPGAIGQLADTGDDPAAAGPRYRAGLRALGIAPA